MTERVKTEPLGWIVTVYRASCLQRVCFFSVSNSSLSWIDPLFNCTYHSVLETLNCFGTLILFDNDVLPLFTHPPFAVLSRTHTGDSESDISPIGKPRSGRRAPIKYKKQWRELNLDSGYRPPKNTPLYSSDSDGDSTAGALSLESEESRTPKKQRGRSLTSKPRPTVHGSRSPSSANRVSEEGSVTSGSFQSDRDFKHQQRIIMANTRNSSKSKAAQKGSEKSQKGKSHRSSEGNPKKDQATKAAKKAARERKAREQAQQEAIREKEELERLKQKAAGGKARKKRPVVELESESESETEFQDDVDYGDDQDNESAAESSESEEMDLEGDDALLELERLKQENAALKAGGKKKKKDGMVEAIRRQKHDLYRMVKFTNDATIQDVAIMCLDLVRWFLIFYFVSLLFVANPLFWVSVPLISCDEPSNR